MDAFPKGYETSRLSEIRVSRFFLMIKPIKRFTKYICLVFVYLELTGWSINWITYFILKRLSSSAIPTFTVSQKLPMKTSWSSNGCRIAALCSKTCIAHFICTQRYRLINAYSSIMACTSHVWLYEVAGFLQLTDHWKCTI